MHTCMHACVTHRGISPRDVNAADPVHPQLCGLHRHRLRPEDVARGGVHLLFFFFFLRFVVRLVVVRIGWEGRKTRGWLVGWLVDGRAHAHDRVQVSQPGRQAVSQCTRLEQRRDKGARRRGGARGGRDQACERVCLRGDEGAGHVQRVPAHGVHGDCFVWVFWLW